MVEKYSVPKHPISMPSKGMDRLPVAPSGNNAENKRWIMNDPEEEANIKDVVTSGTADAKNRRDANRARIDSAFPSQGTAQPASSGSQSTAPDAPTTPGDNQ